MLSSLAICSRYSGISRVNCRRATKFLIKLTYLFLIILYKRLVTNIVQWVSMGLELLLGLASASPTPLVKFRAAKFPPIPDRPSLTTVTGKSLGGDGGPPEEPA
jgi:hypothetical protein